MMSAHGAPPTPGPTAWPLCRYLYVLVLAVLLPVLVFTGILLWDSVTWQYELHRRRLVETAQALSLATDREWGMVHATLQTLAASALLDTGDWHAFHALCTRVIASYPDAWLILFAPSGQQVLNTSRPFGAALPNPFTESQAQPPAGADEVPLASPETVRQAFETGRPIFSDLFISLSTQRQAVSLDMPVWREGRVVYVVTLALAPEVFTQLLQAQSLADDMLANLLDRRGLLLARSREAAQFVGRPASAPFRTDLARGATGWGPGQTLEQVPVYRAWVHSPLTGWATVVAVTQASLMGPVRRSLIWWGSGAVGALSLALSLALGVARRITTPMAVLTRAAALIQRGEPVAMPPGTVWEIHALAVALEHAQTEQRRLERAAQQAEHFAAPGRLVAGLSHELRNPLAAVAMHVELLEEALRAPSPDDPEAIPDALAIIKVNLTRINELLQNYLTLVRVARLQRDVQDLGAAVAAWCREFQGIVGAQGVTLALQGGEGLGLVAFHANALRRVLLNLVQNAAEAMPQGGTITLTGQGTADQVQLVVRDTGCGIPAEHLAQLFEPLHTTKPGGTGLGLHIVQEVVAAHGGQVTVHSVQGQGTTFTVTLPRGVGAHGAGRAEHTGGD